MAEFANRRIDEMLTEMNLLRRLRIFDNEEIEKIIKEREANIYRSEKSTKDREDFLQFTRYETKLLLQIVEIRKKQNNHSLEAEIDYKIEERITKTFMHTLELFSSDEELWKEFFEFCATMKLWGTGTKMLKNFVQLHGDKEHVWKFAADFEVSARTSENARTWLYKAVERHPKSKMLHTERIKLEMEFVQNAVRARKTNKPVTEAEEEKMRKEILRGRCAETAYLEAKNLITDVDFYVNLCELAGKYPAVHRLHDIIYKDLSERFSMSELTWEMRAMACLTEEESSAPEIDLEQNALIRKKTQRERVSDAIEQFNQGLQVISSDLMWEKYLDFLVSTYEKNGQKEVLKRSTFKRGMEGAYQAGKMSEKHFLNYIKFMDRIEGKQGKVLELLNEGTKRHPKSVPLWHSRIRYHFGRNQEEAGMKAFREANSNLMDVNVKEVVKIWDMVVIFLNMVSHEKVDELFKEGLTFRPDLAQLLKPRYLSWKVQVYGINEGRKLAELPIISQTPCLPFYEKLCFYESIQPEPAMRFIRQLHETMVKTFGDDNAKLWLDYVNFELVKGDSSRIAQLHQRAKQQMTPEALDEFSNRFSEQDIRSLFQP